MPLPSASRRGSIAVGPTSVTVAATWAVGAAAGPDIAILITGCDDVTAAVRGYRMMLPRARVFLYGHDLSSAAMTAAERAGAEVRPVKPSGRGALVRRMFAEVEADIYILAHGTQGADACVAPLLVAEIDGAEKDLVSVSRLSDDPNQDRGDRILARAVEFLFGQGGDALTSDFKACSRRFARSYRGGGDLASALDLTLHALRLRMPFGEVSAPGQSRPPATPSPARDFAGWVALARLVGRLFVEERPRRVLGLIGLAIMATGIAAALPALRIEDWHATLPHGPIALLSLGLMVCGGATGVAGLLLDTLAKARQEVNRLSYLAIPRRAEPI